MTGRSKTSKRDQASIKFRWVPLDATFIDLSDISQKGDTSKHSDTNKTNSKRSEPESSEILTTAQLVSAIGKLWDCANRPLSFYQPKANTEHRESPSQNEKALGDTSWERSKASTTDFEDFRIDPLCAKSYYDVVNSRFEQIDIPQKTSALEFCSRHSNHSFFQRYLKFDDSQRYAGSWNGHGFASLGIFFDFGKLYDMINGKAPPQPKYPIHVSQKECQTKTTSANKLDLQRTECNSNVTKLEDSSLCSNTVESVQGIEKNVVCLHSDMSPECSCNTKLENSPLCNTVELVHGIEKSVSSLHFDNSLLPKTTDVLSTQSSEYDISLQGLDNCAIRKGKDILEKENMLKVKENVLGDTSIEELSSVTRDKLTYSLPNQRQALAGALSGTFVSLCLHPVDTIKTVIQSNSMAEKSIFHVVRSIISDRGVTGLYRGIASNIASSAPISAVYTYTYESVKGALLPLLPKEYYSIAHCMAGGCASVATSFIFTPSERIKQQMQVSSHYQNSWAALVGIVGRGGIWSLYAGWGAVLCRNIPHSIIKFYTYETLKQLLSSSTQFNNCPSTCQTLICGGLAGSTAALFTTPFDVVKTRLQTQIPGSLVKYDGVFHALREISKKEGLRGLYRGLTPRMVMYISQGALFFASYEFFKSVFASKLPEICTPVIQDKQNIEGDSTS